MQLLQSLVDLSVAPSAEQSVTLACICDRRDTLFSRDRPNAQRPIRIRMSVNCNADLQLRSAVRVLYACTSPSVASASSRHIAWGNSPPPEILNSPGNFC